MDAIGQTAGARAECDLYLHDGRLIYAKEDCGADDTGRRFFLHITPRNAEDLGRRAEGIGLTTWTFGGNTTLVRTGSTWR